MNASTVQLSTNTYSAYNALKGEVTGDATATVTATGPDANITTATTAAPEEALSFYTLVNEADFPVTINYTKTAGDFSNPYKKEFDHAPFQADYRTIFIGDIAGLQYNDVSVTATLDENWDEDIEFKLPEATADATTHTITTHYAGQIAVMSELIAEAVGTGSELKIEGPMNSDDFAALKAYLKEQENTSLNLSLDLTGMTEMTEIPKEAFFDCGRLYEVKLSDEITRISAYAFSQCDNLAKINIPQKLESMGVNAFRYIALNEPVELPEGFTSLDTTSSGKSGGQFDSSDITAVTLPASIGEITKEKPISFEIMRELTTVTFKSVVTELDEDIFYWCDKLTDIYMLGNTDSAPEFPTGGLAFTSVDKTNVTIHVPQGASGYFSAWTAQDFKVVEMTE